MARSMWPDTVDFYRYIDETGKWAYGPYDTRSMPRKLLNEHDGKGKVQKLEPVQILGGCTLEWVDE